MYPKGFLYFHTTFLNLNFFQKDMVSIFIVELCFNLMITHLISVVQRELLIMMFPMHQALVMIEFTCVVSLLNWKKGMSIITGVQMSYGPTDNSYSSLKQLSVIFVIKIVFLQQICSASRMCTFMSSTFCLSCLSFYLYYSFLSTDAHD